MSHIIKRLISFVGKVKLKDLPKDWQKPVDDVLKAAETAVRFICSMMLPLRPDRRLHLGSEYQKGGDQVYVPVERAYY